MGKKKYELIESEINNRLFRVKALCDFGRNAKVPAELKNYDNAEVREYAEKYDNAKVDPNLNDAFEELRKRYEVNPHLIAAGYTQEEALVNK